MNHTTTIDPSRSPVTRDHIEGLRAQIDAVDHELITAMARRFRLSQAVGDIKCQLGAPVLDPGREAWIVRRACAAARQEGIPEEGVRDLFWSVLGYCREAVRTRTSAAS